MDPVSDFRKTTCRQMWVYMVALIYFRTGIDPTRSMVNRKKIEDVLLRSGDAYIFGSQDIYSFYPAESAKNHI